MGIVISQNALLSNIVMTLLDKLVLVVSLSFLIVLLNCGLFFDLLIQPVFQSFAELFAGGRI